MVEWNVKRMNEEDEGYDVTVEVEKDGEMEVYDWFEEEKRWRDGMEELRVKLDVKCKVE